MSNWGRANKWQEAMGWNYTSGSLYYPTMITSSGSSAQPFYVQPQQLSPVLESPSARLGDREWLDAQIEEVCDLAEAA